MSESLEQMKSDLKEHDAAVEEASGTVRQIQAEMALTQHVINRTNDVLTARLSEEAQDSEMAEKAQSELLARQVAVRGKSFLQAEATKLNMILVARRQAQRVQFEADKA